MTTDYARTLRRQLVEAAAAEQAGRRHAPPLPRMRPFLVAAALLAAVLVAVSTVDLAEDERTVRPPEPERLSGRPLFDGTIEPGVRYATRVLRPGLSFVVADESWAAGDTDRAEALNLWRDPPNSVPARGFLWFTTAGPVVDPRTGREVPPPANLFGWLRRHPDLRTDGTGTMSVGGVRARYLDTTAAFTAAAQRPTGKLAERCALAFSGLDRRPIPCTLLAKGFAMPRGLQTRWIVMPHRDRPLVITIEGYKRRAFDDVVRASAPVLKSLRIR